MWQKKRSDFKGLAVIPREDAFPGEKLPKSVPSLGIVLTTLMIYYSYR